MSSFLKAFIAISVLLNLLLTGIIVGDIGRYFVGQNKRVTLQDVTAGLPADKRERFKDIISHGDQNLGALRQQLSDARKKAAAILKTEPFNKAAYLAQIQEIQQLKGQIATCMTEAVVGMAGQATPQERASMGDVLFPPDR